MELQDNNLVTLEPSSDSERFEFRQRVAKSLIASDLLPSQFRGNLANVLIALDVSENVKMQPLQVMNNLSFIQGKPAFSAHFMTALIISRFGAIHYEERGEGDELACRVWVTDQHGERITGVWVSMAMAKAEGWYQKNSKWRSMPEQMLRYRASSFFARNFMADLLCGVNHDIHEVEDAANTSSERTRRPTAKGMAALKAMVGGEYDNA